MMLHDYVRYLVHTRCNMNAYHPLMFRQNTDNRRIGGLLQKYDTSSKICYTYMTHKHCYVLQVRRFVTLVCTRLNRYREIPIHAIYMPCKSLNRNIYYSSYRCRRVRVRVRFAVRQPSTRGG